MLPRMLMRKGLLANTILRSRSIHLDVNYERRLTKKIRTKRKIWKSMKQNVNKIEENLIGITNDHNYANNMTADLKEAFKKYEQCEAEMEVIVREWRETISRYYKAENLGSLANPPL